MNLKPLLAGSALLLCSRALADETVTPSAPSAPSQVLSSEADRMFPLSESAAVPGTFFRAHTVGQASTGASAFSVGQSVELVPVQRLSLRVTAEFNSRDGFTPTAQAKYQFLSQEAQGVNLSGGLRFKQVGFIGGESEAEAFVSAGRSFGRFLASANAVGGQSLYNANERDVEGHLSLGYQPTDRMLLGVTGRYKQSLLPASEAVLPGQRSFEFIAGPVVGYSFGWVDLSFQYGLYMPFRSAATGQIGVLGANFSFF